MALTLTPHLHEAIAIGDDIIVRLVPCTSRRNRTSIVIEAPEHVKVRLPEREQRQAREAQP